MEGEIKKEFKREVEKLRLRRLQLMEEYKIRKELN